MFLEVFKTGMEESHQSTGAKLQSLTSGLPIKTKPARRCTTGKKSRQWWEQLAAWMAVKWNRV